MIFTITLNPCLDRYLYVDELKVEDTTRVKKIKDYPAGKGIDVSRAIKELDGKSVAISFLGGENGRKIEESCLYAPSIDVPVQSAVGSGDSFLAAYVLKREEGANVEESFKWANASGNASVITPGTELCRKNDVLRLLDEVKIEKIF